MEGYEWIGIGILYFIMFGGLKLFLNYDMNVFAVFSGMIIWGIFQFIFLDKKASNANQEVEK